MESEEKLRYSDAIPTAAMHLFDARRTPIYLAPKCG